MVLKGFSEAGGAGGEKDASAAPRPASEAKAVNNHDESSLEARIIAGLELLDFVIIGDKLQAD
ncbi:hypothetical protein E2C01_059699 [Portunus trituberculatus]|uniref:Uncharacterized protein n=1 Tax=Portunus trituberculatus TaxID=210409 RepID=A0A5B7GZ38_PORTR|nr:hypothetical protein [Portunus trituberculatus]